MVFVRFAIFIGIFMAFMILKTNLKTRRDSEKELAIFARFINYTIFTSVSVSIFAL